MKLVKASEKDLQGIMDMIQGCVSEMVSHNIMQWNEHYPNLEVIAEDIKNQEGYVMVQGDSYVAYVAINEDQSPEYEQIQWMTKSKHVLVVHRLAVNPDFQGKGIAGQVMTFIQEYAKKEGYESIRLDAFTENPAALRVYERIGFIRLGQVFFPYRDIPFYCYEKVIE